MIESIHAIELHWIHVLQSIRTNTLDQFFLFLNFFDTGPFYLLLFAFIWFRLGDTFGRGLFYIGILSVVLNSGLKTLFAEPRPGHIDPSVCLLTFKSFGFPSGAAQAIAAIFGYIGWKLKNRHVWIGIVLYGFVICLSRIYLGLHFFTDILGGLFFGTLLLGAYIYSYDAIAGVLDKLSTAGKWLAAITAPFLLFLLSDHFMTLIYVAITIGVNVGLLLRRGVFRFSYKLLFIGFGGLILISQLPQLIFIGQGAMPVAMTLLQQFLYGLYISYGAEKISSN